MKKILFLISALLLFTVAVFCQTDTSFSDQLVALGLNPTVVSLVLGVLALVLGHVAIPQKWLSILALLESGLHWINEKTNRLSAKQEVIKQLFDTEVKALKSKGVIIPVILLLLMFGFGAKAQNFHGFFQPVNESFQMTPRVADGNSSMTWLFRPSLTLTAVAVEFGSGKPVINSMNSVGLGIGYGKFTEIDGRAYCNFSVNGSLLTQINLNGIMNTYLGGALTIDVFNKIVGFGVGYLDKHIMLLTTFSYSF